MLSLDLFLFQWINAGPGTAPAVVFLARMASSGEAVVLLALLALAMRQAPHRAHRALLGSLTALALAWCTVYCLRLWIPFPRPAQWGLGIQWVAQGPRPGFPSMHVATAFAFACTLLFTCRRCMAAWAALLFAGVVAWSRVCLGLHFPSDVLAGAGVGLACAYGASALLPLQLKWLGRFSAYWSHLAHPWVRRR